MKLKFWLAFAAICALLLFGVIVGTVTQPKGQPITYPQKVHD
jgi:hypothetical protein